MFLHLTFDLYDFCKNFSNVFSYCFQVFMNYDLKPSWGKNFGQNRILIKASTLSNRVFMIRALDEFVLAVNDESLLYFFDNSI